MHTDCLGGGEGWGCKVYGVRGGGGRGCKVHVESCSLESQCEGAVQPLIPCLVVSDT